MAQPTKAALREKLTFEQQSRFDALYDRQQKKLGPATVLSMPLLGTFGLEQFYLGNAGQGIVRLIFSWTLIPTVLALFEVASGDLKKQVAHANTRVSRRVYDEVVQNTPSPASAPASVTDTVLTPNAATEAAALAAVTSVASAPAPASSEPPVAEVTEAIVVTEAPQADATATSTAAPAGDVAQVSEEEQQEETTATTSTFTVAESSASWQQGMDAPVSTGDEQTFTGGTTTDAVVEIAGADATPSAIAAPAEPSAAQSAAEAEPLADEAPAATTPPLAEEGVLVFVADEEPLASDVTVTETVQSPTETTTTTIEQLTEVQQQTDQVAVVEGDHVESQHYHKGKLVEASRHDVLLSGEINSLLTDTTTDTLLSEVEANAAHAPTPWLDVSPLQNQGGTPATPATGTPPSVTPATPAAESPAAAAPRTGLIPNGGDSSGDTSGSDTNVPSGGIGGPATDVPGGGIGSPGTGTNVPGGGIGGSGTGTDTSGGDAGSGDSGGNNPPPHVPPYGERPV